MIRFPSAKINLGLNVMGRLPDGYHAIESVLVPVPLHDALEAVVDPSLAPDGPVLMRTGLPVPGPVADDLCLKAVRILGRLRPLPGLRIHLHKAIPIGAGLGGGSSDAAHLLLLLNDLLGLHLRPEELHALAATLGSDCPFFLRPVPQLAEGRGERLRPVDVDLRGRWLVLVNPGLHVSTADVYRATTPTGRSVDLARALQGPLDTWMDTVVNAMEGPVFRAHPEVGAIKDLLVEAGASYAAMSGSGSSVFGVFTAKPALPAFPAGHAVWTFPLPAI